MNIQETTFQVVPIQRYKGASVGEGGLVSDAKRGGLPPSENCTSAIEQGFIAARLEYFAIERMRKTQFNGRFSGPSPT
jgi:hypothetical protein